MRRRRPRPIVTLLTDFGNRDGYVGVMKGVLLRFCPEIVLVDLAHDLPPQSVLAGALVLESAVSQFPRGTVHLAVIDPGVGGPRPPLLVETEDFTLVGPGNGALDLAARRSPVRRAIRLEGNGASMSRTFHGRDVFAPAAGRVAAGSDPGSLGTEISDWMSLELPEPCVRDGALEGEVLYVDHFGNLVTNIRPDDFSRFESNGFAVTLDAKARCPLVTHYGAAGDGEPLALWNSWGRLEIAVRNGSASSTLGAGTGSRVRIAPAEGA